MQGWGHARRARRCYAAMPGLLVAAAIVLGGCKGNDGANLAAAQPRGATVAFESIDGLPQGQFTTLVRDLNDEAQSRRLAVLPRGHNSAYRVRGYLAAEINQGHTTVSWVWDVFDHDERRVVRISGSETAKGKDGWQAADDAMLQRIAHSSMTQLATFLTSPEVAPGTPDATEPQVASAQPSASSPEAAGIYRIFQAHADPIAEPPAKAVPTADQSPPLPPHHPPATVAASETVTLAAARH